MREQRWVRIVEGACPRCRIPLVGMPHPRSTPLVCPSCHGVHLRGTELRLHFGGALELLMAREPIEQRAPPSCPKGCGPMRAYKLPTEPRPIVVDMCSTCAGAWFDAGEIQAIFDAHRRRPRESPEARRLRDVERKDRQIALQDDELAAGGDGAGMWLVQLVTQLPLEGYNPVYRVPLWTWALIASCFVVLGLEISGDAKAIFERWAWIPAQVIKGDRVLARLVGTVFMHGSVAHLLGNMYFLKIFGDNVEDRLGRLWFPILYFGAGTAATVAQHLSDPLSTVPLVGASGAIAGVIGAYMVFFPDVRVRIAPSLLTLFRRWVVRSIVYFPFWFLWQVFASVTLKDARVAWWAHIGGFVFGALFAWLARSRLPDARAKHTPGELHDARG